MFLLARTMRLSIACAALALLAACAHPISINAEKAPERVEASLVKKTVAYTMSDADRMKQVITPGGGGDKVSYYPYRDLEKAIRDGLRAVYQDVVVLRPDAGADAVRASGAAMVFRPQISTASSSPSPFTWPPTEFSSEVSCLVTDAGGAELAKVTAKGTGRAEFDEFKSNFSLSAQRAGTQLSAQLAEEIRKNPSLR